MCPQSTPWLGIDFGTCKTSAAALIGRELRQVNLSRMAYTDSPEMPTSIFFEPDGGMLVGDQANRARQRDAARYLHQFKLEMEQSTGKTLWMNGNSRIVSWQEIVAAVLGHVRRVAEKEFNNGDSLSRVVLTVPALYVPGGAAWKVMEESARLAGFTEVSIIREPHAAALYYDYVLRQDGVNSGAEGELVLVYDLGGGTFDPALIRRGNGEYRVERADGHGVRCGGIFFDEEILKDFRKKCPETMETLVPPARNADGTIPASEVGRARTYAQGVMELERFLTECKHGFSQPGTVEFNELAPPLLDRNYRITLEEFNALIGPMLDSTIECCDDMMKKAGVAWKDLARIILVGGSCSLLAVREKLQAALRRREAGETKVCWQRVPGTDRVIDPRFAVCRGAAIARDLNDRRPSKTDTKDKRLRPDDKPTLGQARDACYWAPRIKKRMEAAARESFTILMIGRTGVGKSSTVNSLLGADIAPIGAFEVTTRKVESYPTELFGAKALVVDTPGLCDDIEERGNDADYIAQIKKIVVEVDCLFFVTPLNETRVRRDEKDGIRLITRAFGPALWNNATIIFTFADKVTKEEYPVFVAERGRLIRQEIAGSAPRLNAAEIPAVAVNNRGDFTPDGEAWLPELFVTAVERMSSHGLLPFLTATAPRVEVRTAASSKDSIGRSERPIVLEKPAHISRLEQRCGDLGEKVGGLFGTKAAEVGRTIGESIGKKLGSIGSGLKKLFNW